LKEMTMEQDKALSILKTLADGIDRSVLKQTMREEFDVGLSGEVYDTPLHMQPVFSHVEHGRLPGAEQLCAQHVCLPLYPALSDDDADYVIESFAKVYDRLATFGSG
jgi:dTDP-4-amino-4,6-dideoxygalactose transaminase